MNRIKKNTLGMFDCLKGLIILYVLLSHCYTDIVVANNLERNSFFFKIVENLPGVAMAVLFIVSGYGFRAVKSKKMLRNQVRLYIKPCVIVYLCAFIARIPVNILCNKPPLEGNGSRIAGFLLGLVWYGDYWGIEVSSIQVFWYLIALFQAWILLSIIMNKFHSFKSQTVAVVVCSIIGILLAMWFRVLPFCIVQTLLSVGFLYFGYLCKKNALFFKKIAVWQYGILLLIAAVALIWGDLNIGSAYIKLGVVAYIGILCACFLTLRLYLFAFCPDWKILQPVLFYGKNSFMILCIHGFEHQVIEWKNISWLYEGTPYLNIWIFFVCRTAVITLVFLGIRELQKIWKRKKSSSI